MGQKPASPLTLAEAQGAMRTRRKQRRCVCGAGVWGKKRLCWDCEAQRIQDRKRGIKPVPAETF